MRAVPPPPITSRHNPVVARFKAAADSDAQWMLLDGAHLVGEAVAAGLALECVAVDPDRVAAADLDALARAVPADKLVRVGRSVLEAMSPVRTPTGIVALAARPPQPSVALLQAATALLVGAVDIQDPGNLGAIIRAAEAGGASGVLTTPGGADPFGWKAVRGAMGSAFRLPVIRSSSADEMVDQARAAGLQVVAAVGHGHTPMHAVDFTKPTLIVLGSEGHGLPPALVEAADVRVSIPMTPPVESLNVAVAAALLVYEARRQREAQSQGREGAKAR
jgi:TrmH family RNA methyltransferase